MPLAMFALGVVMFALLLGFIEAAEVPACRAGHRMCDAKVRARRAAGEAWEARPDDQPVTLGSGPPWIVPAKCPGCGKQVNQQMAARESQPHCQNCARLLPAYPYL